MPPEITPIKSPEFAQQMPFQQQEKRAAHGLLTEALDTAFDALPGRSKSTTPDTSDKSGISAADVAAGFIKSVPLFMGPGKGLVLSAVLHGLDEVHSGDSTQNQLEDFILGSAKGVGTKLLMDKFGGAEMSMVSKGFAIGGGSSLIDSALTRSTWINQSTGQLDLTGGLEKTAFNSAFGAGVGMAAFPLGHAFGSRVTPSVQKFLGTSFDKAMVGAVTTGGAFGFTSGVVGETASQLYSGSFDPLAIARRGIVEGLSTAAAGGVGHRFSAQYSMNRLETTPRPLELSTAIDATGRRVETPAPTDANAARVAETTEGKGETRKPTDVEVDNRPIAESDRARVEKEWEGIKNLTPEQLTQAREMARQDLSEIQIEPGKSAWDVINNGFKSGSIADPEAVMTTVALAREHFASLRSADGAIIPDQAANWVHTMGELARVVQYSDMVRNTAVQRSGETDPAKMKAIADKAMSPEATKLAMIASAGSDSTKSQAAPYMRMLADGRLEADNLPANFHTHHLEGVLAIDGIRPQIGLNQAEFDLVKNGILAHQVAPPETIMGLLYFFKTSGAVGAIQKAAEAGDTSKLAPWVQEEIKADPQFPQKLADALKRETRTMRDPAAEAATGEVSPKAGGMPVIKAIADTSYLLMPKSEVPKGAEIPAVKMTADGKGWELDLNPDAQMLLRLAGDSHWYVPHQATAAEKSSMTPEQVKYFDDLWKVSQGVFAGDNGQYGARESVYKYVAAMRGPGTPFHDGTAWDSIASIDTSRIDARRILDQAGRQIVDDTSSKTAEIFDRQRGSFRQRADQSLLKEFNISIDGKSPEDLQAVLKRTPIYKEGYPTVDPSQSSQFNDAMSRLRNPQSGDSRAQDMQVVERATGLSPEAAADYVLAQRTIDALQQIPYYGTPITEADYKDQTPAYQQAVRVRTILGDAARREAAMDPTKTTDNFQTVRRPNAGGQ
ncbi:MAG: hypothetical protein JST89_23835 [Cyanobacteria bacterium SZAS-4]|nr:hypothetical protein [Cyanobacteria bacterium SZAS-4]